MESLRQYLFIDIETVSGEAAYDRLSPELQDFWAKKATSLKLPADVLPEDSYVQRAAIYSEFAKVICISLGCLREKEGQWKLYLRSLTGHDEHQLLTRFCEMLTEFNKQEPELIFCGHNIKEFDIPFLCRRMIIHGMELPKCMDSSGKKPWEVTYADTMELWRYGDKKNFTSLSLLATVLGVPTPKDDIDGSMVGQVYWQENNLDRIAMYCSKDVITSARVFLRLKNLKGVIPEPVYLS